MERRKAFIFLLFSLAFLYFSFSLVQAVTWSRPTLVEVNLNVNQSDFWDDLDTPLDSWIDIYNATYDSYGAFAQDIYVNITGDTMTGNLTADWFKGKFNWTSADNWNIFDGSTLTFNESKLEPIYHNPTQVATVVGTIDGGTLADVQHPDAAYDGITFNFSEEAASPGLELYINFTGLTVDTFSRGLMRYRTSDLKGDYPLVQMWSYTNSEWEDYPSLIESDTFATMTQPVFDGASHISDGVAQMRIYKASIGNTQNEYYLDWIAIVSGVGLPASAELDPVFNIWLHNASLESNLNGTGYNITADYYFGDGAHLSNVNTTGGTTFNTTYNTHLTSTGATHTYIDQAVTTAGTPTFSELYVDDYFLLWINDDNYMEIDGSQREQLNFNFATNTTGQMDWNIGSESDLVWSIDGAPKMTFKGDNPTAPFHFHADIRCANDKGCSIGSSLYYIDELYVDKIYGASGESTVKRLAINTTLGSPSPENLSIDLYDALAGWGLSTNEDWFIDDPSIDFVWYGDIDNPTEQMRLDLGGGNLIITGNFTFNETNTPYLHFDDGDFLRYISDQFQFFIGNTHRLDITATELLTQDAILDISPYTDGGLSLGVFAGGAAYRVKRIMLKEYATAQAGNVLGTLRHDTDHYLYFNNSIGGDEPLAYISDVIAQKNVVEILQNDISLSAYNNVDINSLDMKFDIISDGIEDGNYKVYFTYESYEKDISKVGEVKLIKVKEQDSIILTAYSEVSSQDRDGNNIIIYEPVELIAGNYNKVYFSGDGAITSKNLEEYIIMKVEQYERGRRRFLEGMQSKPITQQLNNFITVK